MSFLLSPIISLLIKAGTFKALSTIKEHLVCWIITVIAAIFALLFLNIALYSFLAINIGAIYAALVVFLVWLLIGAFAIMWANSNYSKMKNSTSHQISEFTNKQRDFLIPIALTALPILKRRKKILATLGVIIVGGAAASISKIVRRYK